MAKYQTIKELVIDTYATEGTYPSRERLGSLVKEHFPTSKWKDNHHAWYKSQIKSGRIYVPGVSEEQPEQSDLDATEEELIEATISLERDLHSYYKNRVGELEPGLKLVADGVEHPTEAGRIDLLAMDVNGDLVVIELKAGEAKDSALGQLLGYMGSMVGVGKNVRGILVASDFETRVKFAVKALPNVKLLKYDSLLHPSANLICEVASE